MSGAIFSTEVHALSWVISWSQRLDGDGRAGNSEVLLWCGGCRCGWHVGGDTGLHELSLALPRGGRSVMDCGCMTIYDDRGRRAVGFDLFFTRKGTNNLRLASTRRLWQTVPRSQWQYSVGTSSSSAFSLLVATGRGSGTLLSTSIRAAATIPPLALKTRESFMGY